MTFLSAWHSRAGRCRLGFIGGGGEGRTVAFLRFACSYAAVPRAGLRISIRDEGGKIIGASRAA